MNKKLDNFNLIVKLAQQEYAQNGKSVRFNVYENSVLQNGRPDENYIFARDVKGADPIAHGKVILKYGDEVYNFMYGMDVYGCDHKAHIAFLKNKKAYNLAKKLEREHTPLCEL